MRSADKVALVNTMYRAYLNTRGTSRALLIVDCGKVVDNLDSSVRTGFLALTAGDASVFTSLSCNCALVVVGALNYHA